MTTHTHNINQGRKTTFFGKKVNKMTAAPVSNGGVVDCHYTHRIIEAVFFNLFRNLNSST